MPIFREKRYIQADRVKGRMSFVDERGRVNHPLDGQWMVLDQAGRTTVVDDMDFRNNFEPIDPESQRDWDYEPES
jgi:hypothetical protein